MALVLPPRIVKPAPFHKVHDYADILAIRKQNERKKITLPERYLFLAEHAGAIRATLLAGLERNPNTAPAAPVPPPTGGGGSQPGSSS